MLTSNISTSSFGKLNLRDFIRSLAMTVAASVVSTIYAALQSGGFAAINWSHVGEVAASAGLGYLITNLLSKSKIIVNADKETVQAVKEGEAVVNVSSRQ